MNDKKAKLIRALARAEARPGAKNISQVAHQGPNGTIAYLQGSYPYILNRIKKVFKTNRPLFDRVAAEFQERHHG